MALSWLLFAAFVARLSGWITPGTRSASREEPSDASRNKPHAASSRKTIPKHKGEALAAISPSFRWQKTSASLRKLLSRSAQELHDAVIFDIVHPDDAIRLETALQASAQTGVPQVVQFRLTPPTEVKQSAGPALSDTSEFLLQDQNQIVHTQMSLRPHLGPDGTLVGYRCRFKDVSRLARAEESLRRTREELDHSRARSRQLHNDLERLKLSYRDLYHNAPVMYFSLDEAGRFVSFNDTLVRTLGYEREELLRASFSRLLPADGAVYWIAELARQASGESSLAREQEREMQWLKKDGAALNVWIRIVPIFDDAGVFVRLRGAALDLTERIRLSQELRARGDELEHTNTRLLAINSELEDFTHVVSHDLKEPLRTLQAFSQILAEDFSNQLGPDGFEAVNHLVQASRRMGVLIDELLTLGQAGRITGAPQVFNLNEAVATVRRDLGDLIQRKGATILTEGTLPSVAGDRPRIVQLLTNLVANGLKYNKDAAPRIVVGQADAGSKAGCDAGYALLFVRDNGIGIDPHYHDQIFGIFRRLHRADEFEGTGAGLAICKKIVQAHGGQIWVESAQGQGAIFYFTLPLPGTLSEPAAPVVHTAIPFSTDSAFPFAPATRFERERNRKGEQGRGKSSILLVEDTEEIALVIRRFSKRAGQDLTWFNNAEAAWDYLQTARPDLLLLDINLPGMNGIELCKKVRADLRRTTPIVLFSQETGAQKDAVQRESGADHIFSKDLLTQPAVWQERIDAILSGQVALAER